MAGTAKHFQTSLLFFEISFFQLVNWSLNITEAFYSYRLATSIDSHAWTVIFSFISSALSMRQSRQWLLAVCCHCNRYKAVTTKERIFVLWTLNARKEGRQIRQGTRNERRNKKSWRDNAAIVVKTRIKDYFSVINARFYKSIMLKAIIPSNCSQANQKHKSTTI